MRLARSPTSPPRSPALFVTSVALYAVAFAGWVRSRALARVRARVHLTPPARARRQLVDLHLCDHMHALPANPQLHAWWHLLSALSSHLIIVWLFFIHLHGHKRPAALSTYYLLPVAAPKRASA